MEREKNSDELLDFIIQHAAYYLEESGEFFPFGGTVGADKHLRAAAVFPNDEQPGSQEVVDMLNEAFDKGLADGQYKMVGMGIDVVLPENWLGEQLSAVQILLRDLEGPMGEYHLPYFRDAGGGYQYLPLRKIS
jgi:hypothetical protein